MKNSNDDIRKLNTAIYIRCSREDGLVAWRLGFESQKAWELILKYVN